MVDKKKKKPYWTKLCSGKKFFKKTYWKNGQWKNIFWKIYRKRVEKNLESGKKIVEKIYSKKK